MNSTAIENGNLVIRFQGAPSTSYAIKAGEDLVTFPENLGNATTDGSGVGTATVPVDPSKSKRFIILQLPQ